MTQKEFWILGVSKMPRISGVKVKILSSKYVPAKGERLAILGKFSSEKEVQLIRDEFGDEKIIAVWKQNKIIRLV